jgi:hypothetical protein
MSPALRPVLAALAVLALAATVAGCSSDSGSKTVTTASTPVTDSASSSTTTPSSGGSSSPTTTSPAPSPLWRPPAGEQATSAEDAAVAFAHEYVAMFDPKIAGSAVSGGPVGPPLSTIPGATVVRLQPGGSGPVTAVSLVKQGDGWQVVRADAGAIRLDSATAAAGAGGVTTITVKGTSQTFEGTVTIQARPVLWVPGTTQPVAQTSAIGGASDGPGPFSATLTIPAGTTSPVVLVLAEPDASGRGQISQATAVAVALPS